MSSFENLFTEKSARERCLAELPYTLPKQFAK